jgi:hypothetical protein
MRDQSTLPAKSEQETARALRDNLLPLPGPDKGYTRVLVIGTTGAGKTTMIRQLIGTDLKEERFPATAAGRTTIGDTEIVLTPDGQYQAVATFLPRETVLVYIEECIAASALAYVREKNSEAPSKLLEHGEKLFRLRYVLGTYPAPKVSTTDKKGATPGKQITSPISDERALYATRIEEHLNNIRALAETCDSDLKTAISTPAEQLGDAAHQPLETFDAWLREQAAFSNLVDDIFSDVEQRFEHLNDGTVSRDAEGWPVSWSFQTTNRKEFMKAANLLSSNHAAYFGRLLTPLVSGMRTAGPFTPTWLNQPAPRLVIMDSEGLGQERSGTDATVPTSVTSRYDQADVIVLVDNASSAMLSEPIAALRGITSAGNYHKLCVCFTHFEAMESPAHPDPDTQKEHIRISSVERAITTVGTAVGSVSEAQLRAYLLDNDRLFYLANIHTPLTLDPDTEEEPTIDEFLRLLDTIVSIGQPATPVTPPQPTIVIETEPVALYTQSDLQAKLKQAVQEFRRRWQIRLGIVSGGSPKEHWTRIKALTKRVGLQAEDRYDSLQPVAELIDLLSSNITQFLDSPARWDPEQISSDELREHQQTLIGIKQQIFKELHLFARAQIIELHKGEWRGAYEDYSGTGSTAGRAAHIELVYRQAAPKQDEELVATSAFIGKVTALVDQILLEQEGGQWLQA